MDFSGSLVDIKNQFIIIVFHFELQLMPLPLSPGLGELFRNKVRLKKEKNRYFPHCPLELEPPEKPAGTWFVWLESETDRE